MDRSFPELTDLPYVEPELLVATCSRDGEVIYQNEAWKAVFGAEPDLWQRLANEDVPLVDESTSRAAEGSLVTNQICPVQSPDRDEPLPVLLNFLPVHLPTDGDTPTVQAVTITGEVLAEPSSWTPSQTQRHRMEALGRMTMGIAHDFNNLLSALLGHAELLKRQANKVGLDGSFHESLDTIEQVAVDGATLVEKIQRYIRQENQTHFEPLDLPDLIDGCITLTRPYWYNEPRRQGIAIEMETDLNDVPPISGSPTELREVFVNLILNAVQAMPEGGKISFNCEYNPQRGVHVSVSDTGVGMSAAVREHIFEPLFTTKGRQGTGMGLTVSYGIIQEHEGKVHVESEPGQGTTFHLSFPPIDQHPERPTDEERKPTNKPARVLVVDDEQMVRTVLTKLLTIKGHTVEQASSGAEALALAENSPFDIVFTDQGMPAMSGRQLARALRRRWPELPIVLLTGDTDISASDDVNTVLGKPFKLEKLERTIQLLV